jgi:hypothetical protein
MTNKDSILSHIEELVKKHRKLDDDILELQKSYTVNEDIRRLKTQKLWYKDEIYRYKKILEGMNNG